MSGEPTMCYFCGVLDAGRGIRLTATDQDGVLLDQNFMCAACVKAGKLDRFPPDFSIGDPWKCDRDLIPTHRPSSMRRRG